MPSKFLINYPTKLTDKVQAMIEDKKLGSYLLDRYPTKHNIKTDKSLYSYTIELKNSYMKKTLPLNKVQYDGKINIIRDALGTHTFISRVQGGKLKAKNEIRVATMFKSMPQEFLKMIVTHELAHFKEKEHNKSFYKLCEYIEPNYHQYEFDLRVYLTHVELFGKLYS